ncbi:MAG: GntR family transcriptional regulator [Pseudomonadota bacterium]
MDGALQTMPEQLAERIYALIVAGRYPPGARIREEEMSEIFGVSRGPVREAVRILERDSVVRVLPNKGAQVTLLSARELDNIFEIRRVLAGAMVRRLGAPQPALEARFKSGVEQLERLAADADAGPYVAVSVNLLLTLAQASGNGMFASVLRSLARQSWRYTQLALTDPRRRLQSAKNWRKLFEAIVRGESELAVQAMEKLVDDARQGALKRLQADLGNEGA